MPVCVQRSATVSENVAQQGPSTTALPRALRIRITTCCVATGRAATNRRKRVSLNSSVNPIGRPAGCLWGPPGASGCLQNAYWGARTVRAWLPDTTSISVRSYWGSIMRKWDLTHLEEHCGEQGSSTRQYTANIVLGGHLGTFQINLQFCWPSPPVRSQYVVHFRDDVPGVFKPTHFRIASTYSNLSMASVRVYRAREVMLKSTF